MTLTGEPKPSVVTPIRPEARQSFLNNDPLIDTILSSIQPVNSIILLIDLLFHYNV